jgi:hypothetical protein
MIAPDAVLWLQGLAAIGCTFLELVPETKRTRRPWHCYSQQTGERGLANALRWLGRGSGLGILPGPPLWILDADSPHQVERITSILLDAQLIPLVVQTPSGGAHFYFQLPAGFRLDGLKNHLCHPYDADSHKLAMDFKFGPRSLLVAPGTVRNGRRYEPTSPWRTLPVVDPRMFLPEGKFWREQRPFLVDQRPLKDRIARACTYLKTQAPLSISGQSGHKTLAAVAAHLVRFLDLDPELAHHLMTHGQIPWNKRCKDSDGKPFPWAAGELWSACAAAVDALPAAGVKALERQQAIQEAKGKLAAMVGLLKESITHPGSVRVPVSEVLDVFEWTGQLDLTSTELGIELSAQGIPRVRATGKRIQSIAGLNLWAMQSGILEAGRKRQEGRIRAGCPLLAALRLMKHEPALEQVVSTISVSSRQIEQVVSTISEVA